MASFLAYVEAGDYTDTFMHRSVPGFVVQGGGFGYNTETDQFVTIASRAPVQNEPVWSNQRGTIAMAKKSTGPSTGTNQWFFNLADNSKNLDRQNAGFTAFGEVTGNGMAIVDAMAELPRGDFSPKALLNNPAFTEVPVRDYSQENLNDKLLPTEDNIVLIENIVVLDAAADTAAGLDPTPNTGDNSRPDSGNSDTGGGGGSAGGLMLLGLLGAGVVRRLGRKS